MGKMGDGGSGGTATYGEEADKRVTSYFSPLTSYFSPLAAYFSPLAACR
ncbi:MAG: hypothetical protein IKX36_02935 [Prevotella sp.]|nr:hypothetical protein [Prevotella sp.]